MQEKELRNRVFSETSLLVSKVQPLNLLNLVEDPVVGAGGLHHGQVAEDGPQHALQLLVARLGEDDRDDKEGAGGVHLKAVPLAT